MKHHKHRATYIGIVIITIAIVLAIYAIVHWQTLLAFGAPKDSSQNIPLADNTIVVEDQVVTEPVVPQIPRLDKDLYDASLVTMTNGDTSGMWPVQTEYPLDGALLPMNRIIAYYGNLYSTRMGILGEFDSQTVLDKLMKEVDAWNAADPTTRAIPALHYIAVVAQADAGKSGTYRARMPFAEIDKVIAMAQEIDAEVFLDIQVGLSTIQQELPQLEPYLILPNVHVGIDPEFSMKDGSKPGKKIGTFDAQDINYVSNYLAEIVRTHDLPPKVLVIHRFTQRMVTNYQSIIIRPEVQIVMHMDGWGHHARKFNTYRQFIHKEPVQFTGFKIFYKNDLKEEGSHILTPTELLTLQPRPVYIQYQ
jgi:hypothetical protein